MGIRKTLSFTQPDNTTAQKIAANNPNRRAIYFFNNAGNALFLGGSDVSSSVFHTKVAAGASFIDEHSVTEWYGITAAGTGDIKAYEVVD